MTKPLRDRPMLSFAQYKEQISPNTLLSPQTYAAYQFSHTEVPPEAKQAGVGAVFGVTSSLLRSMPFFTRGEKLRITAMNQNWIFAVPAAYVERFWE